MKNARATQGRLAPAAAPEGPTKVARGAPAPAPYEGGPLGGSKGGCQGGWLGRPARGAPVTSVLPGEGEGLGDIVLANLEVPGPAQSDKHRLGWVDLSALGAGEVSTLVTHEKSGGFLALVNFPFHHDLDLTIDLWALHPGHT